MTTPDGRPLSPVEPGQKEPMRVLGRRMAKFSSYVFASSLLLRALTVVQSVLVVRLLGPHDFGLLSLVGYAIATLGLVAGLGMPLGLVRLVSDARVREPEKTIGIEVTYLWLTGLSTVAMVVVLVVMRPVLALDLYGEPRLLLLLLLAAVGLGMSSLTGAVSAVLQAHQRIPTQTKLSVFLGFISVPLVLSFTYFLGLEGVFVAGIVGGIISLLVNGLVFRGAIRRRLKRISDFSRSAAKELLALGLPNVMANLLSVLGLWVGLTTLEGGHGLESVGLFAVANGVAGLILFVQGAVVVPFVPAATEEYARGIDRLELTTLHTIRYVVIVAFPLCLLAVLFGGEVITILYGREFLAAKLALGLLAAVSLLLSFAGPAGYVYYALGLMRRLALLNLIWFILLVTAVFLLVPSRSFEGLAVALLIVFLFHLHLGLVMIRDRYQVAPLYRVMLATEGLAVGLAALAAVTSDWILSVRVVLFLFIAGAYLVTLKLAVLSERDKAFLRGLVSDASGKVVRLLSMNRGP